MERGEVYKMTDNEIIKSLVCKTQKKCKECPYVNEICNHIGSVRTEHIIDLINRQKAEIERLTKELNHFYNIGKMYSEVRAEAINEFVEKVIFEIVDRPSEFTDEQVTPDFLSGNAHRQNEIIDLIKKMAVNCDANNI